MHIEKFHAKDIENIFSEIVTQKFQNLGKEIFFLVQETYITSNRQNHQEILHILE